MYKKTKSWAGSLRVNIVSWSFHFLLVPDILWFFFTNLISLVRNGCTRTRIDAFWLSTVLSSFMSICPAGMTGYM